MSAQDLLHPEDSDREWLTPEDFALADQQLASGVDEDLVYRRLRDWAHNARVYGESETAEALHNDDSDCWEHDRLYAAQTMRAAGYFD